jgi:hypothetical protein
MDGAWQRGPISAWVTGNRASLPHGDDRRRRTDSYGKGGSLIHFRDEWIPPTDKTTTAPFSIHFRTYRFTDCILLIEGPSFDCDDRYTNLLALLVQIRLWFDSPKQIAY